MNNIDIDMARADQIPQSFTQEQVDRVKSAVNVPRANVQIIRPPYSPDEHMVTYWREYRDGVLMQKPVYERTYDCGALPNNTSKTISVGMDVTKFYAIEFFGTAKNPSTGAIIPLPFVDVSGNSAQLQIASSGDIRITTKSNLSVYEQTYVTVIYFKTTDEWEEVVE